LCVDGTKVTAVDHQTCRAREFSTKTEDVIAYPEEKEPDNPDDCKLHTAPTPTLGAYCT
jgi:hypothetical protein